MAALALLLSSSCEKQNILGGYVHTHIFFYPGEGQELINAHGYEYSIPAEGGDFSLGIVSYGLARLVPTETCEGISASFMFEDPIPEERIYEDHRQQSSRASLCHFERSRQAKSRNLMQDPAG